MSHGQSGYNTKKKEEDDKQSWEDTRTSAYKQELQHTIDIP
jgi:hypothetical protein